MHLMVAVKFNSPHCPITVVVVGHGSGLNNKEMKMRIKLKKHKEEIENMKRFDIIAKLLYLMNGWTMNWNELMIENEANFWSLISYLRDMGEFEICNELFRGQS